MRATLVLFIIGILCTMLVGCPGCAKKHHPLSRTSSGANPALTPGIDEIILHFTGGYSFVIPLSGDRVLAAKADSGDITRENGLQVFRVHTLTADVYEHGTVVMRMRGDTGYAVRLDKTTLDLALNGHVVATETAESQQANADALRWKSNETLLRLQNFIIAGKNPAGESYSLRAPAGTVNTTFTDLHWTGRGWMEMVGRR